MHPKLFCSAMHCKYAGIGGDGKVLLYLLLHKKYIKYILF